MKTYIQFFFLISGISSFAQVVNDTIYIQPITATQIYLGQFGKVTLQIDDAGNDGFITKPLIVAEGFDSGLLGTENGFGDNDIQFFTSSVNITNSTSLEEFLTGGTNFTTGDQDYDIIYVNWDNGRDYLQRNAFALQEVIKWVNEQKALSGSPLPEVSIKSTDALRMSLTSQQKHFL